MKRLKGFDYTKPYYYMVTLMREKNVHPFCEITQEKTPASDSFGRPRYLIPNTLTESFSEIIRTFHTKWLGIRPIDCFIIMPDHIHLLIRLTDCEERLSLGRYVYQLMKALAAAYREIITADRPDIPPIFKTEWHDWIVKKTAQLAVFTRYIHENPKRHWLRRQNRRYFRSLRKVTFLGREWFAYGNTAILDLPILKAVKGHRATQPGTPEWETLVAACERLGPLGAGVGTFMSPLEKACGNAIAQTGGKWIVLSPDGFHERWHPGRIHEKYCAEGRMLFLSLYPAMDRLPTKAELYRRCHEMGDIASKGLLPDGTGNTQLG